MRYVKAPSDALVLNPPYTVHMMYWKFDSEREALRTVEARATWWAGDYGYLHGHDELRGDDRTFRTDRVASWEVAGAPAWLPKPRTVYSDLKLLDTLDRARPTSLRAVACHPRPKDCDDATRYAPASLDEFAAMTLVLVHVAGIDRRVAPNEQKAIDTVLGEWAKPLGISHEGLVGESVDRTAFADALQSLATSSLEARLACIAGGFIVANSSGGLKPEEVDALLSIETALDLTPG